MNRKQSDSISLREAQELIQAHCIRGIERYGRAEESVALGDCLGRYTARPLTALTELPGFDQSLRDGFALGPQSERVEQHNSFRIVDEVAAGDTRHIKVDPGEAVRIMTGGLLPRGAMRVVPKENCEVTADTVCLTGITMVGEKSYIHRAGSDIKTGSLLVAQGRAIRAADQILLSGVGYGELPLVKRPQLSFLCTGSELLMASEEILDGKKFSANSHLLKGLIQKAGAVLQEQERVTDDPQRVSRSLARIVDSAPDIIITTGGMGPGKYDLVEGAFRDLGGEVLYNSLALRPGKSTLFGTIGRSLFFGMPGPPPAVYLLFQELIAPAILACQGEQDPFPVTIEAALSEDMHLPPRGLARLKEGLLSHEKGHCVVRPAGKGESGNCYIYCTASQNQYLSGQLVPVHLRSC
jgi:molybdopterin molybdotransferase